MRAASTRKKLHHGGPESQLPAYQTSDSEQRRKVRRYPLLIAREAVRPTHYAARVYRGGVLTDGGVLGMASSVRSEAARAATDALCRGVRTRSVLHHKVWSQVHRHGGGHRTRSLAASLTASSAVTPTLGNALAVAAALAPVFELSP